MTTVSVVVPVFGCAPTLGELVDRVCTSLGKGGFGTELILVDDGNPDVVWDVIRQLSAQNHSVRGLRLSRNFGQHAAIMAGLRASTGDVAIVMDCDLQDPPELIPMLLDSLREFHVAIGIRKGEYSSRRHRVQAFLFARLLHALTGAKVNPQAGSFSAISRPVINEYVKFNESDHHYLYILHWLGFPTTYVEYTRNIRSHGDSSYRLLDRIRHALRGLFFESARFLYFVATVGIAIFVIGLALSSIIVVRALLSRPPSGWISLMLSILTMSGFIVAMVAVVGIYVARSFEQVKSRPIYVIETSTE